ncbi:hypothetical protein Bca52824_023757 [Brassica carinata]|uniref:Uncharacterized protein n=1 Tax=Brassica carinata TaxID=52824 RepID=A0A8X7VIX1_BRACI|nr:hypothetical protein Bca52824_023757 [Brassica carinata]
MVVTLDEEPLEDGYAPESTVAWLSGVTSMWERRCGVEVAAASPPDPSFSLLDPPVVVWFQGAVLGSRFVDLPRCLGGYEPSTQRLESSRVPLLVDASHLEGYLSRRSLSHLRRLYPVSFSSPSSKLPESFLGDFLLLVFSVVLVSLSSTRGLDGLKLPAFWFSEMASSGEGVSLGGLRLYVPSSMTLLVVFNISHY